MAQLARATGCDAGWGRTCVGCARWLTSISKPFGCRFSGDEASLGDAVTGISRADSASGETELGRCCTNFLWFATAVGVEVLSWCRPDNEIVLGLSALLTTVPADVEPGGLPAAARVLRKRRRSRGREKPVPDLWTDRAGDAIALRPLPHGRRRMGFSKALFRANCTPNTPPDRTRVGRSVKAAENCMALSPRLDELIVVQAESGSTPDSAGSRAQPRLRPCLRSGHSRSQTETAWTASDGIRRRVSDAVRRTIAMTRDRQ